MLLLSFALSPAMLNLVKYIIFKLLSINQAFTDTFNLFFKIFILIYIHIKQFSSNIKLR